MKRGSHICHYIRRYQQCCLEKTPPRPPNSGVPNSDHSFVLTRLQSDGSLLNTARCFSGLSPLTLGASDPLSRGCSVCTDRTLSSPPTSTHQMPTASSPWCDTVSGHCRASPGRQQLSAESPWCGLSSGWAPWASVCTSGWVQVTARVSCPPGASWASGEPSRGGRRSTQRQAQRRCTPPTSDRGTAAHGPSGTARPRARPGADG